MLASVASASVADKVRAAFPFEVEKYRLSGPDNMTTPHYGLFRSDNSECVGSAVRKGYEPHTTDDVIALAESAGAAFGDSPVVTGAFFDGHYLSVAPSRGFRESIFGTTDNIWPRLLVKAPYDGRAFEGVLGMYRDVCRNMSVVRSTGETVSRRIVHRASLREKMDDLRAIFASLVNGWPAVVEAARAMDARRVVLADFLRAVYPLPADDATRRSQGSYDRRIEKIVARIMRERELTGRGRRFDIAASVSAWEAYNGVQGYVQHDATRRGTQTPFGRAMSAIDDAAVSRAMELALAS